MIFSKDLLQRIEDNSYSLAETFLAPAKTKVNGNLTLICPACGNGSGKDGDGLVFNSIGKYRNKFHCYKEGKSYSIFDLYGLRHNADFKTAVTRLAGIAGLPLNSPPEPSDPVATPSEQPLPGRPATDLASIWRGFKTGVSEDPYRNSKGMDWDVSDKVMRIGTYDGKSCLMVAGRNEAGDITSIQCCTGSFKRNIKGSALYGSFAEFSDTENPEYQDVIAIAEGATKSDCVNHELGMACRCSFGAGNLKETAEITRRQHPDKKILLISDLDSIGLKAAREAALAVDGYLAVPFTDRRRLSNEKDIEDYWRACGNDKEAFKTLFDSAILKPLSEIRDYRLDLASTDELPEKIEFLWNGFIPKKTLTILAGQEGLGKTTLACSLAAIVSRGGELPFLIDGIAVPRKIPEGRVVIWSAEDSPSILRGRLQAARAKTANVKIISENILDKSGSVFRAFNPERDFEMLLDEKEFKPDVLIIDPITHVINGDMYKMNDVQKSLRPLVQLAEETGCAVIGITHLRKGKEGESSADKIVGSKAFRSVARMVLMLAENKETGDTVLVREKSNLTERNGGFRIFIDTKLLPTADGLMEEFPFADICEYIDITADELLAQGSELEKRTKQAQCEDWLRDRLDTPAGRKKNDLLAEGRSKGFGQTMVYVAGRHLKVLKKGGQGNIFWLLPEYEVFQADEKSAASSDAVKQNVQ